MTTIHERAINLAERATGKDLDGDGDVGMGGCPVRNPGTSCPFRNKAFTLPIYPALNTEELPKQAEHGVLGQLDGTWVNAPGTWGIHTTIMPAPGTTSEQMFGAFHFITQEYTETYQFSKKSDPVRNRLGSNEQFVGQTNYEQTILPRTKVVEDGKGHPPAPIHNEVGQYLWLGVWTHEGAAPYEKNPCLFSREATEADVKNDFTFPTLSAGAQGPQFIPPFSISRQGSIPHGNAIQLFGKQPSQPNKPEFNPQNLDKPIRPYTDIPGAPVIYPGADCGKVWDADSVAFHPSMGYTAAQLNLATSDSRAVDKKPAFAAELANYPDGKFGKEVYNLPDGRLNPNSGEAYMGRILNGAQKLKQPDGKDVEDPLYPFCVQPNFKLVDANQKLIDDGFEIISHDEFTLNTDFPQGLQGGSLNNHGTDRYCKVHDMKVKMWISKVKNKATGDTYLQLQYEQVMHFQFGFGVDGTQTLWPHIQCNTLIKKDPKPADCEVQSKGKRARSS